MRSAFALVLHSHLPYCRGAGRWPHGEEWIHEAILATYIPLAAALHDLRDAGVPYQITLGLTPTLLEQLGDADIRARFVEYVDDQIRRAEQDARRFGGTGERGRAGLAVYYARTYTERREQWLHRFAQDLSGAFADLARSGHVEILTSAATHGYLPLLDPASVDAQLAIGRRSTRRHTGIDATGIWLPECAYRPGLEVALERRGITHFFTDSALLAGRQAALARRSFGASERGGPRPSGAETAVIDRSNKAPDGALDDSITNTIRPYLVGDSGVATIARHERVSGQVWSAVAGYPGDPTYREFHRKDDRSGLRYWRVTGTPDLGAKDEYAIEAAALRAREHATHFAELVRTELDAHDASGEAPGLLAATFDSELFGHWWFEGVEWIAHVLRALATERVATSSAIAFLDREPPRERVELAEGSWGKQNDHSTWWNEQTRWMHDEVAREAALLAELRRSAPSDPLRARAARQALRELLLAESSDWPFLLTTGQAADYAIERFRSHALRFHRAIELARHGTCDDEVELRSLERADNVFVDVTLEDYGSTGGAGG